MVSSSITNETEYNEALEELEVIFDAKKGTADGNRLELLAQLIEEYENKFFPFD